MIFILAASMREQSSIANVRGWVGGRADGGQADSGVSNLVPRKSTSSSFFLFLSRAVRHASQILCKLCKTFQQRRRDLCNIVTGKIILHFFSYLLFISLLKVRVFSVVWTAELVSSCANRRWRRGVGGGGRPKP